MDGNTGKDIIIRNFVRQMTASK